jgi:hypothetical protein
LHAISGHLWYRVRTGVCQAAEDGENVQERKEEEDDTEDTGDTFRVPFQPLDQDSASCEYGCQSKRHDER